MRGLINPRGVGFEDGLIDLPLNCAGSMLTFFLLLVVFGAPSTGGDASRINDITTDLENPPQFALEPPSLLSSVRTTPAGLFG